MNKAKELVKRIKIARGESKYKVGVMKDIKKLRKKVKDEIDMLEEDMREYGTSYYDKERIKKCKLTLEILEMKND